MEKEKINISKNGYLTIVFGLLLIGILTLSLSSYLFIMNIETKYSYYFNGLGMALLGYGVGLAYARTFKIESIDD